MNPHQRFKRTVKSLDTALQKIRQARADLKVMGPVGITRGTELGKLVLQVGEEFNALAHEFSPSMQNGGR
jgi:hypothetical protein